MVRKPHPIAVATGLLIVSCLVQVVLVHRAIVPGLDAVGFVESAQRIESDGILNTARHQREQPLFAAWLWLVHEGLDRCVGPSRCSWATSAQLAAAIPLVLAVVPVYFLSIRLFGAAAALAGSLLFCVLPEVARLGADGISDSTHLLFFSLAFWAMVVYLTPTADRQRQRGGTGFVTPKRTDAASPSALPCPAQSCYGSLLWLLCAGVLAAVALLVRAEALVLPAAFVATLGAFQLTARHPQPWRRMAGALGCLALGAAAVLAPYLAAMGATSPRTAVARLLGRHEVEQASPPGRTSAVSSAEAWLVETAEPMSLATKDPTTSLRRRGYAAAVIQFGEELASAFGWVFGVFALYGLWRLRAVPARAVDQFARVYFLLFSLAVVHFASREGYLGARHLLTLVVVGIGCAGYGVLQAGQRVRSWIRPRLRYNALGETRPQARPCSVLCVPALVLLAAAIPLVQLAEPLHASRVGHRLAAEWLAVDASEDGAVLDTRGWTSLYSGRPTYRYDNARAAFDHPRLAYIVLERRELEYDSRRARTLKRLLAAAAEPVAEFPGPGRDNRRQQPVIVYRWDAERFSEWVADTPDRTPTPESRHARARLRLPPERL